METTLSQKKKSALITLGIFILTFILWNSFFHQVNAEKVRRINVQIEEAKKKNRLLADIKNLEEKISSYEDIKAEKLDASYFSSKIVDLAAGCGIKIESVTPQKQLAIDKYTFLPCKIVFSAPYSKLRVFISKIENDKKFMKIENLSIIPMKDIQKRGVFNPIYPGGPPSEQYSLDTLKKSKDEGVWVDVNMQVAGVYFNE